jgi:integrase
MKAGREHRVPLSDRAVAILKAMATVRRHDAPTAYVFPGQKPRSPLSNMSLSMALRRAHDGDATPHGFRSSFRDWAGDLTDFPREIAEAALAHAAGDETELAYRRGDALERRRKLMEFWEKYIG